MNKVVANAGTAAPVAVVVAWSWQQFMGVPMSPEVAAALGGLLGPVMVWILAWLPKAK